MNKLLDIYSDYLIAQNQYATAVGLSDLLEGRMSHDKVTRFLNTEEFTSKELWEYVKPELRKIEEDKGGVLIIDDTIEEKAYTDENEIICWHYSHSKGRCVKGVNLLSCLARYSDIAFPISYQPIHKEVLFSDVATRKVKRQASVSKNQMFRSMLTQAMANKVKFEYILADTWFGAKKNMEFIQYEIKKKFVFGIKTNRLIALSEKDKKRGLYQNLNTLQLKDGEKRIVWVKDVSFPVALIAKIFKNEDGSTGILYLVTNDLESSADRVYEVYQKRWRIEEYHKSIKQNASLEKSPTKVMKSQKNHIFASIIAYCKLEFLKTKTSLGHFGMKYMLLMKANRAAFLELEKWKFNHGRF
jgi:DDE superfamily endonuclease